MKTERTEESQLQRASSSTRAFTGHLAGQFKEPFRMAAVGRHYEAILEAESIEASDHRRLCELTDHSQCEMGVFRVQTKITEIVTL